MILDVMLEKWGLGPFVPNGEPDKPGSQLWGLSLGFSLLDTLGRAQAEAAPLPPGDLCQDVALFV